MTTNSKPELTCLKVEHFGNGWMHDAADDTPYDVDGVMYCGRCHRSLPEHEMPDKHKRVAECWVNWWLIEGMPIPKAYLTECEALESQTLFNTGTLIAVAKHEKFQV